MLAVNAVYPAGSWSVVWFPKAQYWGQFCLMSLSMIWTRGSRASSMSLQTILNWVGLLICGMAGRLCRGIWINGPRSVECSVWQSAKSCPWITTICCSAAGWGQNGKLPCRKGPWGASQQQLNMSQHLPRWTKKPMASCPVCYQQD